MKQFRIIAGSTKWDHIRDEDMRTAIKEKSEVHKLDDRQSE